jgi:hypothetical protein
MCVSWSVEYWIVSHASFTSRPFLTKYIWEVYFCLFFKYYLSFIAYLLKLFVQEKFEDTKEITRSCKSKTCIVCPWIYGFWLQINAKEYHRCNQKWTIQRNLKHPANKTNKTKTQHNMCWKPRQQTQIYLSFWPLYCLSVSDLQLLHTNGKFTMGNWNHLFTHTIVFLTDLHCQCLSVGHGMK